MPSHPDRVRSAPLREGYQFGDANVDRHYRRLYDAAKRAEPVLGDTITVRLPRMPQRPRFVVTDPATGIASQQIGPARFVPFEGYDVIEGEHE